MILGIDPGLSGALAFLDGANLIVHDMPTFELPVYGGKVKKVRRVLDEARLAGLLMLNPPDMAIVENVHSMPEQGVASSFKFGMVFGAIRGELAALGIPVKYVEPAVWKRYFKLTSDKDKSRQIASQLMPAHAHHWPLKKHDGRAEAALLALYGAKLQ